MILKMIQLLNNKMKKKLAIKKAKKYIKLIYKIIIVFKT